MISKLIPYSLLPITLLMGCIDPDILVDDVSYYWDKSRCDLRVGVLAEPQLVSPRSDKLLTAAFTYFREREVDAVVIVGNVTQDNALAQWRGAKKIWDRVFPSGKRPNGDPVELIVVTGESDEEKVIEQLTGEKVTSVFSQQVRGYTFIGANWKGRMGVDAWALKPILAKVDKVKPFFYVQSLIPYDTCAPYEGRATDYDGGKVTYLLSKYPNAVAICGRSHTSLTDDSALWCGDFTCVNAGSFAHVRMRGEKGAATIAHQGLVMSVYGSSLRFERIDLETREKLGPDWEVSLSGGKAACPQTAALHKPPQFWDDTRLMVFPSPSGISVRFPPILAKHTDVRAYDYVVKAGDVEKVVTSPGWCFSERFEKKPVTCDFSRAELPKGEVRISVTPRNAFGDCGRPISETTNML